MNYIICKEFTKINLLLSNIFQNKENIDNYISCKMNYIDIPKQACFTPLYSPRTSLSNINQEMDKLTTNLAINIDKYILGFFKDAFEQNNNQLTLNQFVSQGLKHLKSWQRQLKFRKEKIYQCLYRLFQQGDSNGKGVISWTQFNSMLIEKGLNLKSLRNQEPGNTALMKSVPVTGFTSKYGNPIQKMVSIGNKIAIFTEQGSQVIFFNPDGSPSNLKPLILSQQALTVQTSVSKRAKGGLKETVKKDLVVAEYKNVLLDMIYINDSKYDMLITSSTDFIIKGWDISSNIPILAKQPQNEDQKMQHQFPVQIHTMAWDSVNQILYCCGKTPKIYEWMVKTDSQRELFDPDGHTQMISAMIMMSKLQFLATGGYDGKLILWDTISQTKKFKYKEHTRSISSMAFHQGLILLFTAAYDHSICVWNPYIQSLIHKIINNVNVIQLDIIPDTNMLLALDTQANVKIREINKFSLVSSFSIDKHQHKIEPSCMISTSNLKYYFAGLSVSAYEYIHVDANVILDSTALCLKYEPSSFNIYCPIKNHIVAWNLLTGNISSTLRNQTSGQITSFDIFLALKLAVIGDMEGNLLLRKLQNGVLVKKLYKHKLNVTTLLTQQIKSEKIIFSASYDGQIAIFQRDNDGDFNFTRTVSIKKMNPLSNITSLCFQHKRNTLVIGTNFGQIFFLDIDKNKMISKCQTQAGDIQKFVLFDQDNILLSFTKKAEIFGLYLPPHIKKFKSSCHLVSEQQSNKISSIAMSTKNKRCYIGFQNGDLMCFWLNEDIISDSRSEEDNQNNTKFIRHIWKTNFTEIIRNIILIESEDVLVTIIGANTIVIVACQNGTHVAEFDQKYNDIQPTPILFLDDQNNSVYIKSHDISIPIKNQQKQEEIRRVFDPMFYLNFIDTYQENINLVSNAHWKFNPKIDQHVNKNIEQSIKLFEDIQEYQKQPKKLVLVKAESQPSFNLTKAIELQKKWEKQKEQQDSLRNTKQQSLHHSGSLFNCKFGSLSKTQHKEQKSKQQTILQNSSPLYRLGAALKSLNQKDTKAQRLLDMAQKQIVKSKINLKLPKISSHKGQ